MKIKKIILLALGAISFVSYGQFNYGEALQKSLLFYEAQQSGELPDWNRVSWRGDSALNDGSDVGLDLTGGWYDAGDHVKFGFPMASSVTALAWGGVEFEEEYRASGQLEILKRNLRFVTDYFIKCHSAPNEFYGQVGNGSDDHAFWGSAEVLPMARPAYKIDAANPGSDLAGETAAAMAAVSMLFQDDDPAYSATLLEHAIQLYNFADTYRGEYSDAITDASGFYNSFTGYQDEIVWGALWLYRATGDISYLEKAEAEYPAMIAVPVDRVHSYSWDNKTYGSFVLLSMLTDKEIYKIKAEDHLDYWTVGSPTGQVTYSPGGQAWEFQWGSLRHSSNTSFLALVYSDNVDIPSNLQSRYHDFAVRQINYALGDNPINRSFLIGYGNNPANNPHHRTGHGAWANSLQGDPIEASHTLFGALVGGPGAPDDQFVDDRGDFQANEVACDYNACFTGAVARLYGEFGGNPLSNFPVDEVPTRTEIGSYTQVNADSNTGTRLRIRIQNRSAWPARIAENISFRYFFDISEGVAEGYTINDYAVRTDYSQGPSSFEIKAWDADTNIYYVDVSLDGDIISPIGNLESRREVQISFQVDSGAPYNSTNDWSFQGLTAAEEVSENIPVYSNGVLIFGNEPDGGDTPSASFTASVIEGITPLTVDFDASASSDPNGDDLSYSWNFGNGESSSLASPSVTFMDAGSYLVSLTVSDGVNTSIAFTRTITVEEQPVEGGTITGGPFAFTVGDGEADNVSGVAVSGNEGETSQWVVTDDARNILGLPPTPEAVDFDGAGEGTCFIYHLSYNGQISGLEAGNNLSVLDGNFDLSNRVDVIRNPVVVPGSANGGTITGGPFTFTVGDGIADNVSGVTVSGNEGDTFQWVVTDDAGNILGLPPTPEAVDFDGAGTGTCYIYHLSYNDNISGLDAGNNLSVLEGDFDLSNRIDVLRNPVSSTPGGGSENCDFNTPISTALPSLNTSYENIFVLGNGGPDLSNVTNFTINWDLDNNGLYQFSMNTNNGQPNWWNDLMGSANQNFNAANPAITLTGTDFAGLDGSYYAAVDNGNLALVSQSGNFTIYFSGSNTAPACDEGTTTPAPSTVDGGTITGGPFAFTVGDGIADNVSGVTVSGNEGDSSQWVVTDDARNILGLPPTPEAVDFDGAGNGTCFIYHLSFNGEISGLEAGNNLSALTGDFDLSNNVEVVRTPEVVVTPNPGDGEGDCSFGTPLATALESINTTFENVYVLGAGGPNLDSIANFTVNWDLDNNGLYQFAFNLNQAPWYVNFSNDSQNFSQPSPAITLVGTGITGLDGTYYAAVDSGNLVLVSPSGYTIYFSNSDTAPNCDGGTTTPTVDGGTITGGPYSFIVGDGIADNVSTVTLSGNVGETSQWVVTDDARNILGLPPTPEAVDFDGAGEGTCFIYHLSFNGEISGLEAGNNLSVLGGDYDLSNRIDVVRELEGDDDDGGTVTPPTTGGGTATADNEYIDRFNEMRNEIYDPSNGYFSADGSPHHSIETLIVEAPDYGHESTSELYSYWMWLEAMHGRISGDWQPLRDVWEATEEFIIPTTADQPTNGAYNPAAPAAYAPELPLPSGYPAPLEFSAPVGVDPVSAELTAAYGPEVYQMHWLLDNDNFYGYGNRGDGVSTPSYINTFQRGEQESVYETIPHPSWESFDWGGESGFLPLFTLDANYAEQWRYTSATDADARAVQAMYWALEWANEQEANTANLDLDKASKMGDYLRLGMFDKYFKPLGVQSATNGAGTGYDSAHYLMSWFISWGGSADTSFPWAFRISASHCHFGYQNPIAAYALSQVEEMQPISTNGVRDWDTSLGRQMEFYTWLQSEEGGIAGGATNSWNGDYSTYPAGKSTFYDMAFDTNPVYHDPGSGTWFGWQAWSMERVAEYYYITNDPTAKTLMDKWSTWVESEVQLVGDNDFLIPATLEWTGEPDTWNANNPGSNSNLHVEVTDYNVDLGIAASTAKTLIYYAAATEKYGALDTGAQTLAKEILDRMWTTYRDDKGCSSPESRGDFSRIFEEEVFVPNGFTGVMGNGDPIEQGISFLDIRSGYLTDQDFPALLEAYESGEDYTTNYHRTWAQMEIALANAEYGFFFGEDDQDASAKNIANASITLYPNPATNFVNVSVSNIVESFDKNVVIADISGAIIYNAPMEGLTKEINISGLADGVYLVTVYVGNNKVKTEKLVVN